MTIEKNFVTYWFKTIVALKIGFQSGTAINVA